MPEIPTPGAEVAAQTFEAPHAEPVTEAPASREPDPQDLQLADHIEQSLQTQSPGAIIDSIAHSGDSPGQQVSNQLDDEVAKGVIENEAAPAQKQQPEAEEQVAEASYTIEDDATEPDPALEKRLQDAQNKYDKEIANNPALTPEQKAKTLEEWKHNTTIDYYYQNRDGSQKDSYTQWVNERVQEGKDAQADPVLKQRLDTATTAFNSDVARMNQENAKRDLPPIDPERATHAWLEEQEKVVREYKNENVKVGVVEEPEANRTAEQKTPSGETVDSPQFTYEEGKDRVRAEVDRQVAEGKISPDMREAALRNALTEYANRYREAYPNAAGLEDKALQVNQPAQDEKQTPLLKETKLLTADQPTMPDLGTTVAERPMDYTPTVIEVTNRSVQEAKASQDAQVSPEAKDVITEKTPESANELKRRIAQLKEAQRIINDLLAADEAKLAALTNAAPEQQSANEKKSSLETFMESIIILLALIKDMSNDIVSDATGDSRSADYEESSLHGVTSANRKTTENKGDTSPTATTPEQQAVQPAQAESSQSEDQKAEAPLLEVSENAPQDPAQVVERKQLPDHQMTQQPVEASALPEGVKGLLPLLETIDAVMPALKNAVPVEISAKK